MTETGLQARLEALFVEELQDNLRILENGVAALDGDPGAEPDTALIHQLFRAAHSLKGAAHSAGVTDAVAPCHRLEELLAELRDGTRTVDEPTIAALAEDIDRLGALEQALSHPDPRPQVSAADPSVPDRSARADTGRNAPAPADPRARIPVAQIDHLVQRTSALVTAVARVRSFCGELTSLAETATTARRLERRAASPTAMSAEDAGAERLGMLSNRAGDVERDLTRITADIVDSAQELRIQPFRDVTDGLGRAVRELCRTTDTLAEIEIVGGGVGLDRDVGDALREPLLHLVRNAVDHGIEQPDRRAAVGKPTTGTIRVSAAVDGPQIVVVVADDGAGVDVAALQERSGRSSAQDPADSVELAFAPGVSTAAAVTDVSGRGVGLDAARARVESLGGTIHLQSQPGEGTQVEVRVPRTLAVLRVLIVDIGDDEQVALPIANVSRLHRVDVDDIERIEDRMAVSVGRGTRPAVPLVAALGLPARGVAHRAVQIAVELADEPAVLLVDRAVGEVDVVLQSLPPRVPRSSGVVGAAVLASHRAVLVVNPSAIVRAGLAMPAPTLPTATTEAPMSMRTVLLAEDSLTTRALERSILERAGYEVVVAVDGAEALRRFREVDVDVVVSDVDMPHMSGIELCRRIRSSPKASATPVILVTSLASDEDRQRGLEAGANAYIVKSAFDQAALLDAVGRFV